MRGDRAQAAARDRQDVIAVSVRRGRRRAARKHRAADVDGLIRDIRLAGELARERDVVRRVDRQVQAQARRLGRPDSRADVGEAVFGLGRDPPPTLDWTMTL